jgi:hypothetical protein
LNQINSKGGGGLKFITSNPKIALWIVRSFSGIEKNGEVG